MLRATKCIDIQLQLDELSRGVIPDDLQTLTDLTRAILCANGLLVQSLAVMVAKIATHIGDNKAWLSLCHREYGLSGSYLYHLRQVGSLLLALAEDGGEASLHYYRRLYQLPYNKLITLARLTPRDLSEFLRVTHGIDMMSREALRAAIDGWQGKSNRVRRLGFPGLDKLVAYIEGNEDRLEEIFTGAADTPERAQRCVITGFRMVAGALAVYKRAPAEHLEVLTQLHADLTDELADLERAIAAAHENL